MTQFASGEVGLESAMKGEIEGTCVGSLGSNIGWLSCVHGVHLGHAHTTVAGDLALRPGGQLHPGAPFQLKKTVIHLLCCLGTIFA